MRLRNSLAERIAARTEPEPNTGCHLWVGALNQGYAWMSHNGRAGNGHRVVYELYRGPIPPGMVIDHRCHVRSCVNPDHLRVVTLRENIMAPNSESVTKINAEKTTCIRGHALSGVNLRFRSDGGRRCVICCRDYHREYQRGYQREYRLRTGG